MNRNIDYEPNVATTIITDVARSKRNPKKTCIYLSSSYLIFSSQDSSKGNQFFPIAIHWSRKRDNSDASIILGKNPRLKWNNLDPPRIDASISQPFVVEFLRATKVTIIPTLRVSFSKGRKEKESKK